MNVELIFLHDELEFFRLRPVFRTSNRFLGMTGDDQEDDDEVFGVLVDRERVLLG